VRKNGPARPPRQGGPAGCSFLTSFFGQKILREVLKRKMRFPWLLSQDYLFGRTGSSRIKPFKQYFAPLQQPLCPEKLRVEAPSQEAIDGVGEAMRAQATQRDQEDRPHPLRRACPDRSYHTSQLCREGKHPFSRSKVGTYASVA
jgi:hypothetical protein